MRRVRMRLLVAITMMFCVVGCPGRHLELKPLEEPQLLAAPSEQDRRYTLPCSYPSYAFDNDPLKLKSKQDGGVIPARGGPRPPSMGGMQGPGGY